MLPFAIVLLTGVLLVFILYQRFQNLAYQQLQERAVHVGQALAYVLRDGVDRKELETTIQAVASISDIQRVIIAGGDPPVALAGTAPDLLDQDLNVLADYRPFKQLAPDKPVFRRIGGELVAGLRLPDAGTPASAGGQQLTVMLVLDTARLQRYLRQQLLSLTVIVFALIFVTTLIVYLSLKRYVLRPLFRTVQAFNTETGYPSSRLSEQSELINLQALVRKVLDRLARSESLYRALYNNAPIMLFSIDGKGRLVSVSDHSLHVLGYTRGEVIGMDAFDLFTEESRRRAVEKVLPDLWRKGELKNAAFQLQKKNGELMDVLISAAAEQDAIGNPQGAIVVSIDITAEKLAQQTLAIHQERFHLAVKAGEIGIWDWYIHDNRVVWNDQMYKMFGVRPDEFALDYTGFINCVHAGDRERVIQATDKAIKETGNYGVEFRIVTPDDEIHHIEAHGRLYSDNNDTPERMTGVCIDVTERKKIEQALIESEERFQLAVNNAEEGIWDRPDIEQDWEYWSPRFKELLGYRDDEIEARRSTFTKLLHPDDVDKTARAMAAHYLDNMPYAVDCRLRTKSGAYRWFHSRGSVLRDSDGKPRRMAGTIASIDERVHDEQALNRLNTVAADPGPSLDAKVQNILKLALDYLGLSNGIVSRIHGDNYDIVYIETADTGIKPGDRFSLGDTYCVQTMESDAVFSIDYAPEGEFKKHPCYLKFNLVSYIGSRLYVGDRLYGTLNFSSSTSRSNPFREREKVFVQLVSQWIGYEISREEYIQTLIDAEKRLEKTIEDLVTANTELNRFAYVASHDLQEPLRMVVSFTQLLVKKYGDRLDETAREYMKISAESAERMQSLILDLLQYSRADAETVILDPFDSKIALDYALANLAQVVEEKQAQISIASLPEVYANSVQLSRLFQNLISNALKYHANGTVPVVNIAVQEEETEWCFSISDNGIGMKAEYLQQIFEPFKRLHHKDEYEGSGIGLAICKKIVANLGGRIWVKSAPGEGSVFYFTVPRVQSSVPPQLRDKENG